MFFNVLIENVTMLAGALDFYKHLYIWPSIQYKQKKRIYKSITPKLSLTSQCQIPTVISNHKGQSECFCKKTSQMSENIHQFHTFLSAGYSHKNRIEINQNKSILRKVFHPFSDETLKTSVGFGLNDRFIKLCRRFVLKICSFVISNSITLIPK